jgi:UDP-N-acetylmuramate--alanine ligase
MDHRPHIHCIGIGGIGLSAIARYYHAQGFRVTGTNLGHSPLLDTLSSEWIEIVDNGAMMIDRETTKVIYTEAIIDDDTLGLDGVRAAHQAEVKIAQFYDIPLLSYPEALAEVLHSFPIKIAVAGAHGKSTTSAMMGTLLHDNTSPATTITGTLVKAFWGKNVCIEGQDIMVIEACEYRNAFLNYKPDIAIITNIDPDHLDFFKTDTAYYAAFERFMSSSRCVVMLGDEYEHFKAKTQHDLKQQRGVEIIGSDKQHQLHLVPPSTLVLVHAESFEVMWSDFGTLVPGTYTYSLPELLVPGGHIRLDASLAYVTSQLLGIDREIAQNSLKNYPGSWRRMEVVKTTTNNNILISDYGHHPTEIIATLWALRSTHPDKKILVFFEPHQYSRTYDLREEFARSFGDADMTYIVDIYAARDIDERRDMITSAGLAQMIARNSPCEYAGALQDAWKKLQEVDNQERNAVLLLLGAGTIDELREEI